MIALKLIGVIFVVLVVIAGVVLFDFFSDPDTYR